MLISGYILNIHSLSNYILFVVFAWYHCKRVSWRVSSFSSLPELHLVTFWISNVHPEHYAYANISTTTTWSLKLGKYSSDWLWSLEKKLEATQLMERSLVWPKLNVVLFFIYTGVECVIRFPPSVHFFTLLLYAFRLLYVA